MEIFKGVPSHIFHARCEIVTSGYSIHGKALKAMRS